MRPQIQGFSDIPWITCSERRLMIDYFSRGDPESHSGFATRAAWSARGPSPNPECARWPSSDNARRTNVAEVMT